MKKSLFAYAVLATALLFFTCRHYRAENRRLVENQTALAADVTRYRTRLGAEAASVQALRLRCGEFETLRAADAEQIAGDPEFAEFFEAAAAGMAGKEAQTVANLLVNEMIAYLKGAGVSLAESGIAPAQVAALAKLLATDAISSNQAHEVFEAMAQTGDDPNKIVDERGMRQVSDAGALQPIVDEVLANCADQAQQYRDGNQKVIGFLVGQCMKASRGKGNPKLFNELLRTSLS